MGGAFRMSKKKYVILSVIDAFWLGAGLFFKFRLSGYGVMALLCFGIFLLSALLEGLYFLGKKRPKEARIIRRCVIGALCAGLLYFCVVEVVIINGSRTDAEEADYIIVLGAGVDGRRPSLVLWNRLEAAYAFLQRNPDAKAVVSGAQGPHEEISEAECMYEWLTERGIAPERIIKEERARSTAQNIAYSLPLIRSDTDKKDIRFAVVTSEFHLYRAKQIAMKNGMASPSGVAAATTLPVIKINYYIREAFAVTAFWAFGA